MGCLRVSLSIRGMMDVYGLHAIFENEEICGLQLFLSIMGWVYASVIQSGIRLGVQNVNCDKNKILCMVEVKPHQEVERLMGYTCCLRNPKTFTSNTCILEVLHGIKFSYPIISRNMFKPYVTNIAKKPMIAGRSSSFHHHSGLRKYPTTKARTVFRMMAITLRMNI